MFKKFYKMLRYALTYFDHLPIIIFNTMRNAVEKMNKGGVAHGREKKKVSRAYRFKG